MGKGQRQLQTTATQQSKEQFAAGTAAQNRMINSPERIARKKLVGDRRSAINAGDLRSAKDFVSNSARVAEREQQRETKQNLTDTGIAGLASNYADPTQIALAKQMNKDEFARDSAAQTEADAKEYIGQTDAMESDIINSDANIESGIMGTAFGTASSNLNLASQIAAQRASILPGILGAALGAGASIAAGSNWFKNKPCWIAETLYGEADNRTFLLRAWINTEFIKTPFKRHVRNFYLRFGQRIAAKTKQSRVLRAGLKLIFDQGLKYARRWAAK